MDGVAKIVSFPNFEPTQVQGGPSPPPPRGPDVSLGQECISCPGSRGANGLPGTNGASGSQGRSASLITITVRDDASGTLFIDNRGGAGTRGGSGGTGGAGRNGGQGGQARPKFSFDLHHLDPSSVENCGNLNSQGLEVRAATGE